ncbi:hypothetical protein MKEN_00138800 [Mycena kentingensis (nom. inval.)]|nr:hypothetical protein MKEN_00138800 [Mycena kentingensis (nom. inval.)]
MPGPALQYGPDHYKPEDAARYVQYTFIGNYINYATACLLVYELVTSLDDEVERVWPLKWRLPKILFVLNRYFIRAMLIALWVLANYPGTSPEFCRIYSYWQMIPLRLAILAAQGLVVIRVWAIYNNSREMLYLLSTLFTVEFLAVAACVVVATIDQQGVAQPAPLSCGLKSKSGYLAADFASGTWIAPVCFEFVLIVITLFKLIPRWSFGSGQFFGNKTLDVLARDSLVYFLFIFTFTLANALIYEINFTAYYHSLLLGPTSAISCIAVSRMMINIRAPTDSSMESASYWDNLPLSQTFLGSTPNAHGPGLRATPTTPYPFYEHDDVMEIGQKSRTRPGDADSEVAVAFSDVYGGGRDGLGNLPPEPEPEAEDDVVPGSAKPFLARSRSSASGSRRRSLAADSEDSGSGSTSPRSPTRRKPDYYADLPATGSSAASNSTLVNPPHPPMLAAAHSPPAPAVYEPPPEDYVYETGYEAGLRMARERRARGIGSAGSATSLGG